MKRLAIRKTAGLMALIMTISLLIPVIAYAAQVIVVKGDYNPQTGETFIEVKVPKSVYVPGETVSVLVYTSDVVYGTYELVYKYADGDYYYYELDPKGKVLPVQGVTDSVYIDVYYPKGSTVALTTYQLKVIAKDDDDDEQPTPTPGFVYIPPNTGNVVKANPDGTVSASALKAALANGSATVEISGEVAKLPASALTGSGVVTIVSPIGSYELPLDVLNVEALAKELGVSLDDLLIVVTIAEAKGDAKTAAENAITAAGAKALSPVVDFKVEVVSGDKVLREIKKFGKFVKRTVKTTAKGNNPQGSRIVGDELQTVLTKVGEDEVALYSTTNSLYAVIDVPAKSFADLVNHWSKKDVTKLANKLIVEGTGAGKFEPNRDVTRAEFAAMIVRALGLEATEKAPFSDVADSAWYAEAVAAAAEYGIVNGYTDGTFRPNNKITRQELAAMVVRAQKLAGKEVVLSGAEVASLLSGYKDAGKIGAWARTELAAAIKAEIVKGRSSNTIAPTATATRAEAAVMILRFLTNVDFI